MFEIHINKHSICAQTYKLLSTLQFPQSPGIKQKIDNNINCRNIDVILSLIFEFTNLLLHF